MIGILLYDDRQQRFIVQERKEGIISDTGEVVDLHCGDTLTIHVKQGLWQDTRIEKESDDDLYGWYFVGIGSAAPLIGHSAEI